MLFFLRLLGIILNIFWWHADSNPLTRCFVFLYPRPSPQVLLDLLLFEFHSFFFQSFDRTIRIVLWDFLLLFSLLSFFFLFAPLDRPELINRVYFFNFGVPIMVLKYTPMVFLFLRELPSSIIIFLLNQTYFSTTWLKVDTSSWSLLLSYQQGR